MMKIVSFFILFVSFAQSFSFVTDCYHKAELFAKAHQKPLAILFVGSDWSTRSKDVLDKVQSEQFAREIKGSMVIALADFPEVTRVETHHVQENQKLKALYEVEEFPTLILLSKDFELISRCGYATLKGASLTKYLENHIQKFSELSQMLAKQSNSESIKNQYLEAKNWGFHNLSDKFLDLGMNCQSNAFFLIEAFYQKPESEELRQLIYQKDYTVDPEAFLQFAFLDYQLASDQELDKKTQSINLMSKIIESNAIDKIDWRIYELVAKCYQDEGSFDKALSLYKKAKDMAPKPVQRILASKLSQLEEKQTITQETR